MTTSSHPPAKPDELEELLAEGEAAELTAALRVLTAPVDDADEVHARALARALAVPDEEDEEDEELDASALTEDFLASLRAANAPAELATTAHERILQRALAPSTPRVSPKLWIASGALAMAAAVLLTLRTTHEEPVAPVAPALQLAERSRSTEALIYSAAEAGASARATRIAAARASDYRRNRFQAWGTP